jgi:NAD(P)H-hydrate epimerase
MENAGAAVAREVLNTIQKGEVLIVAGRGNNGGDGFVAARHLSAERDLRVKIILAGKAGSIRTDEARANFELLKFSGICDLLVVNDSKDLEGLNWFENADVIVDALLGTGIQGKIRQPEAKLIDMINSSDAKIIAVDTPSGFDPDNGTASGKTVKADVTLTFHRMKTGFETPDAHTYTGKIRVMPIGICVDAEYNIGRGDLRMITKRDRNSHKGQAGKILVIGGGAYSGAPALAAMAALRTGADIVTVAAPSGVAKTIASFSPNLIIKQLSSERLCPEDLPALGKLIELHDVTVMGMGLGIKLETIETVKQIIPLCKKLVLDADALYEPYLLAASGCDIIITPHQGEFKKLAGAIPQILEEKANVVKQFSLLHNVVTLLKGNCDIISDGKYCRFNRTGNPGMTVGGTGDVLAGVTGALFALHNSMDSAGCAAFINGTAGDLAFAEKGYGLVATDIIEKIPEAISGGEKHTETGRNVPMK